jgi:hypothetical protein
MRLFAALRDRCHPAVAPSQSGKHLEESKRAAVGDAEEVANLWKQDLLAIVNWAT